MNAIVKIENQTPFIEVELNGKVQFGVNARDMHHWLESKQDFSKWIKRRIAKYGFIENIDYLTVQVVEQVPHQGGIRSTTMLEYHLSVDMAKELSMVECTDRGREVRLYYIEQEELARQLKDGLQVRIGKLSAQIDTITESLSGAASFLSIHGKQTKPAMLKELDELIKEAQPSLNLENEDEDSE
ncbi:antA/AntB antirepressor family protein [Acinetobacter soli]|uniref:antA/AntB antirepressor family protein n=1 Tax=Acinetobacter soli TaxID=487316 RepID=UPI001F282438|nr:antA/AntB antirepressor family protein [Acinetobacter soli]MCE6007574.1 antA/AntB antirepressor family protein [Acinetobacter soli]